MKLIICKFARFAILGVTALVVFSVTNSAYPANIPHQEIGSSIGTLLQQKLLSSRVAGEILRTKPFINRYYEERGFEPVWSDGSTPGKQTKNLVSALEASYNEGLNPEMYHLGRITNILNEQLGQAEEKLPVLAELDLLCTDAFLAYASHLYSGFLNHIYRRPVWFSKNAEPVLTEALSNAVRTKNVEKELAKLLPKDPGYARLKKALPYFREEAAKGDWPKVPAGGKKIEPGGRDHRIAAVRKRLAATGELALGPALAEDVLDADLVEDVKRFQARHGLEPDGVVGRGTIDALNTSPKKRLAQVVRSLDSMRALSHLTDLEKRVIVNIPEYTLHVYEKNREALKMKVVVGRVDRRTPLLSNSIKYIVFSPKWYVPTSIAVKDKLPKIHKDPGYIKKQGMKVFTTDETGTHEIDPSEVDWKEVDKGNFNYRFVQKPSWGNALGTVKFMFPNRHSVYLHDTPSKYLFKRAYRPYSSGCIRIEKPVEFAKYLLKDKPEWTEQKIKASMGRGEQRFVHLDKFVPVHLVYITAWVDESGTPQFRRDIYNYDHPLENYY